jgi:hypothetical protein
MQFLLFQAVDQAFVRHRPNLLSFQLGLKFSVFRAKRGYMAVIHLILLFERLDD